MSTPQHRHGRDLVRGRLARGVNLSHWYGQVYMAPGYVPEHFDTYMTDADLDLVARMGFDHVRFPLALERLADGSALVEPMVARVEREIGHLHERGLAVVVDLHPENEYKDALAHDDVAVERFVGAWRALAERLAVLDPGLTVLELLNEPGLGDTARWGDVLRTTHAAVREAAPEHAVLVSGDDYSQVPRLLALPELDDPNLVHNLHLYDPVALTHQGAGWSPDWLQDTKGLTYPLDPANVAALREAAQHPAARDALDEYLAEGWDLDRYRELLAPAVAWAAERGTQLTCNEFGVYREFVPRDARLRWLHDVRTVLEENGIGWTIWDYAGDFGVVTGGPGARRPDTEVLTALGLARSDA